MALNNWSGRDQLIIIDIWMKSRCLKVHQTKTLASQKSDIIFQYHAALRITEILYSAIRSDLKTITGFLYVVSVRLLAKLWHNEFSWNHDRTYLLQVMVGTSFFVVQDHNQGPCATWDIYQKRILNSNHAKSRLPKYSLIISYRLNCFEMLYIAQRWLILTCTVGTKYQKHM